MSRFYWVASVKTKNHPYWKENYYLRKYKVNPEGVMGFCPEYSYSQHKDLKYVTLYETFEQLQEGLGLVKERGQWVSDYYGIEVNIIKILVAEIERW